MRLRPYLFALALALPLAAVAAPKTPAKAPKPQASKVFPEEEAVATFYDMCVGTHGKLDAIAKRMKDAEQQKAGNEISAADLEKQTGIKADHAWALVVGPDHQKVMITMVPGICALHMSSGDGNKVKAAFLTAAHRLAVLAKANLKPLEEKKEGDADFASYAITAEGKPSEIVFGLTTASKPAPSGTKHMMTYSVVKKSQEKP